MVVSVDCGGWWQLLVVLESSSCAQAHDPTSVENGLKILNVDGFDVCGRECGEGCGGACDDVGWVGNCVVILFLLEVLRFFERTGAHGPSDSEFWHALISPLPPTLGFIPTSTGSIGIKSIQ